MPTIEISHFDDPAELKRQLQRKFGLPDRVFSQLDTNGKIVIRLDEDDEYLIPDFTHFRSEIEDLPFAHTAREK